VKVEKCAGIDVGKRILAVCVLIGLANRKPVGEIRRFGTSVKELGTITDMAAGKWMHGGRDGKYRFVLEAGVQHFRRKPEDHFGESGAGKGARRQEDRSERQPVASEFAAAWIGARAVSFPPRDIRELRDLTRRRRRLVSDGGAAERNRVQKVLEDANVKIGNVLSDVFGISGEAMLEALLENKRSAAEIAELGHWSLAPKIPQIIEALEGHRMTDHHRFMIRQCLHHMRTIEEMIEELDKEIGLRLKPYQQQIQLACTVPGIKPTSAASILAETGMDMSPEGAFPDCHHLASWATVCPGNNESAGKRKSGRTRQGNRWLRATLTQTGWAGAADKKSLFQFRYQRVKLRRGGVNVRSSRSRTLN